MPLSYTELVNLKNVRRQLQDAKNEMQSSEARRLAMLNTNYNQDWKDHIAKMRAAKNAA